jgi:hypothetical protein
VRDMRDQRARTVLQGSTTANNPSNDSDIVRQIQYKMHHASAKKRIAIASLQRDSLGPRVMSLRPQRRSAPTSIDAEVVVVHHRVLDQEETTPSNLGGLRDTAGVDAAGLQLVLEVRLRSGQLGLGLDWHRCPSTRRLSAEHLPVGPDPSTPRRRLRERQSSRGYQMARGSLPFLR